MDAAYPQITVAFVSNDGEQRFPFKIKNAHVARGQKGYDLKIGLGSLGETAHQAKTITFCAIDKDGTEGVEITALLRKAPSICRPTVTQISLVVKGSKGLDFFPAQFACFRVDGQPVNGRIVEAKNGWELKPSIPTMRYAVLAGQGNGLKND